MEKFIDSGGHENVLGYGICDCYVWLIPLFIQHSGGRCGRCHGTVLSLHHDISKEEALEIYYEKHNCYPVPIG